MALVKEYVTISGRKFVKYYSDRGMYIERNGVKYIDKLEPAMFENERVYVETDEAY